MICGKIDLLKSLGCIVTIAANHCSARPDVLSPKTDPHIESAIMNSHAQSNGTHWTSKSSPIAPHMPRRGSRVYEMHTLLNGEQRHNLEKSIYEKQPHDYQKEELQSTHTAQQDVRRANLSTPECFQRIAAKERGEPSHATHIATHSVSKR